MQAVIRKMLFSVLLVWSICAATTVASAQANPVPGKFPLPTAEREPDPEEIVQVETNLVRLITDQFGKAVTGLKKESFKVYEDQPLASSTRKKLPRVGDSFSIAAGSMMGMISRSGGDARRIQNEIRGPHTNRVLGSTRQSGAEVLIGELKGKF